MSQITIDGKPIALSRKDYVALCEEADKKNAGKERKDWIAISDLPGAKKFAPKKSPAKAKK